MGLYLDLHQQCPRHLRLMLRPLSATFFGRRKMGPPVAIYTLVNHSSKTVYSLPLQ
jgi:hypothetical protein